MPKIDPQSPRPIAVPASKLLPAATPPRAAARPGLEACRPTAPQPSPAAGTVAPPVPMRGTDKVFLRMGNFVCTGLLTLEGDVTRQAVLRMVNDRLLTMERFSQRVVTESPGAESWQRDPRFKPGNHVRVQRCRGDANSPELTELVDGIMATPLDMQRPLWDMTLIHCRDGNTVLLARVHHAVADGMRLMEAVLRCDDDPTRLDRAKAELREAAAHAQSPARTGPLGAVASLVGSAYRMGCGVLTFAQMLTRRADPVTSLKDHSEVTRGISGAMPAWRVQDIKDLAHALGGPRSTLNDVLLATLTGAVRRLFIARGDQVQGLTVRCLQAVNMLPVDKDQDLGNSVGSALVPLPVHAETPRARFDACQAANRTLKASAEPTINATMLGVMGGLPADRLNSMFQQVSGQATCAMSNIKGPTAPLRLGGHTVRDIRWFVSAIGNIGVFAPVISYAGQLRMCLQLDRKLGLPMADFERAVDEEMDALRALAAHAAAA